MLVGRLSTNQENKIWVLKERFRICKIEIHPRERYSYPGEGATERGHSQIISSLEGGSGEEDLEALTNSNICQAWALVGDNQGHRRAIQTYIITRNM